LEVNKQAAELRRTLMKNLIVFLIAGILAVSLIACSGRQLSNDIHSNEKSVSENDTINKAGNNNDTKTDNKYNNNTETQQDEQNIPSVSLAGIRLGDDKEKVIEVLGKDYKLIEHDEMGHFPEPFMLWEYNIGVSVILGKESGQVLEVRSTTKEVETNLGAKVGDSAVSVLSLYRSKYEEPESIHGGKLLGVFKVENGAALIFDFNVDDGLVNLEPINDNDIVERIILTMPEHLDESF